MTSRCFWLTFRKLNAKTNNLQAKKINLSVQTEHQHLTMNGHRIIKNGIANFYGESFMVPTQTNSIIIQVHQQVTPKHCKIIAEFALDQESINSFTCRKNIFISQTDELKITWQAQILDENEDNNQKSQQSEDDFFQLDEPKEQKSRDIYSPLIRQKKPKRRSFRLNEETASEPPSDSPYKFTLNTNDTNKKNIQKKNTQDSLKKIKQSSLSPSQTDRETVHPIFKGKQKVKKIKYPSLPLTPQNGRKLDNPRQTIFSRINLKSMVYTGMFGIISGLTAAQI